MMLIRKLGNYWRKKLFLFSCLIKTDHFITSFCTKIEKRKINFGKFFDDPIGRTICKSIWSILNVHKTCFNELSNHFEILYTTGVREQTLLAPNWFIFRKNTFGRFWTCQRCTDYKQGQIVSWLRRHLVWFKKLIF